ncbi:MAG: hypothetical protein RIQ50_1746 [Bacteroidota bacterium]|jgi:uncharacterized protein involved in exopolysaccharide biosynthesis
MQGNKKERNLAFAAIVGIGVGLLIALVRKKLGLGLLIGIIIAAIIYKRDRR